MLVSSKLDQLVDEIEELKNRISATESQIGRVTSHMESELGLTRRDLNRIEKKLFGDEEDLYGGRIGQITKDYHRMEKLMAYAAGFGAAIGATIVFILKIYKSL